MEELGEGTYYGNHFLLARCTNSCVSDQAQEPFTIHDTVGKRHDHAETSKTKKVSNSVLSIVGCTDSYWCPVNIFDYSRKLPMRWQLGGICVCNTASRSGYQWTSQERSHGVLC